MIAPVNQVAIRSSELLSRYQSPEFESDGGGEPSAFDADGGVTTIGALSGSPKISPISPPLPSAGACDSTSLEVDNGRMSI